jgi:hypothetical protein
MLLPSILSKAVSEVLLKEWNQSTFQINGRIAACSAVTYVLIEYCLFAKSLFGWYRKRRRPAICSDAAKKFN